MTMLTALGWVLTLALLAMAASSAWHGWREKYYGPWVSFALYACGSFILLAVDGVLRAAAAAVLAALFAVSAGLLLIPEGKVAGDAPWDWRRAMSALPVRAAAGIGYLRLDVRALLHRGDPEAEASSPEAAVAEAVATRGIPPVMEDPALGVAPEPAELVTAAVPAAAPYAALAQYIAGFEPEDDMSLRMFMEGNAAGSVMVADAWHHFADTCLNTVGLDPAYVAGILEAGDSAGGHGSLLAQIHKRFGVIYAAVKEWISGHGPLPHRARDFLTDGDA
jgi:hypothetical protein